MSEYLDEFEISEVFYYFATASNRNKQEFIKQLKKLVFILNEHKFKNEDVAKFYLLLTESQADWNYVLHLDKDESKFWMRWLKKMDYVFQYIIWFY